MKGNFFS